MSIDSEEITDEEMQRVYCPSCYGDMSTHTGRTDYQELYLTILKIGQSKVNHGMTYRDLINELAIRGYNIDNGCLQQAVKKWFHEAYFHITVQGKTCNFDELDEHSDCTFILKGESGLLLLEHEKINKTISLARWAIGVAIVIGIVTVIASYVVANPPKNENKDVSQKIQLPQSPKMTIPR